MTQTSKPLLQIAIDGPAASGKGTIARQIAAHYGLQYLDTGSLYRATALAIINNDGELSDPDYAAQMASKLDPQDLNHPDLRKEGVGEGASIVAKYRQVRRALMDYQRRFASTPPGAVLDGRDIGTVILPQATVKLFVTASPEVRAERRFLELKDKNPDLTPDQVLADIHRRDERDQGRDQAPLQKAADAHLLDTTNLDINAAMKAAIQLIDQAREISTIKE